MPKIKESKYFSTEEFTRSSVASRNGIDNSIPQELMPNLIHLVSSFLDPLRSELKRTIHITSGYRNKTVNLMVGGATNSDHMQCLAADFVVSNMSVREVVLFIKRLDLPYDKIIYEFGQWVHVSVPPIGQKPAMRVFTAVKNPGEPVKYVKFQ